jgi:hypothetical protein
LESETDGTILILIEKLSILKIDPEVLTEIQLITHCSAAVCRRASRRIGKTILKQNSEKLKRNVNFQTFL